MFAHRLRPGTHGAALVVGVLALGACDDEAARTDLRPDGPPEVLSVLVMTDKDAGLIEQATFCKTGDTKRPTIVGLPDFATQQVCDDDLTKGATPVKTAVPTNWYVRVMFDELLDPNVEELVPVIDMATNLPNGTFTGTIATTLPVTLTCGGKDVTYDGYYSPSGNNVTWPVGPSLFIRPTDLTKVATSAECTVTIKDSVHDKTGIQVPTDQRTGYKFNIDTLQFTGSTPALADPGMEEEITADSPLILTFNAFIDAASLAAAEVTIKEGATCAAAAAGTVKTAVVSADADGLSIDVAIAGAVPAANAFNPGKAYEVTFSDTNAVADVAGGPGALPKKADFTLCFTTAP